MLVIQQINVLPYGSRIGIFDEGKIQLDIMRANSDGSLIFNNTKDMLLYENVYSTFRVRHFEAVIVGDQILYKIEVR